METSIVHYGKIPNYLYPMNEKARIIPRPLNKGEPSGSPLSVLSQHFDFPRHHFHHTSLNSIRPGIPLYPKPS